MMSYACRDHFGYGLSDDAFTNFEIQTMSAQINLGNKSLRVILSDLFGQK